MISEKQFNALAEQGFNRIPVTLETMADLDTPLSIYLKLANKPYSFLLESVVKGERLDRYSIIGLPARTVLRVHNGTITVETNGEVNESITTNDPLEFIERFQNRMKAAPVSGNLRFVGGLTGYFGYDAVRYIESKLDKGNRSDTLGVPEILLMLTEELLVIDNLSGKLNLIVYADPATPNAYINARARLDQLRLRLRTPVTLPAFNRPLSSEAPTSELSKEAFLEAVAKCKEYILDGDIMQVQISRRVQQSFDAPPINLYRALRCINPSPYMYYFDLGDFHIVGASPEILVRLENEKITLRPIAGTRRRGKDESEDKRLAEELLSDPKERAEHLMLIDLGRNDVGRVSTIGSVNVTENMIVERYSHVMHLVSNVEGNIKPGISPCNLLRASFPAGTVTGTPKVRAMEIIDEMETVKRGIYGGAVGHLGFNGNLDMAIAIRTAIIKDKTLFAQAAAGIVADSIPENEWAEVRNKTRAVLCAAEMVLAGLDTD